MGVDVYVGDEQVDITLTGLDQVWALKREIELPFVEITDAIVAPVGPLLKSIGWRLGGTVVPGIATAGRFTSKAPEGGRQFWVVYRDPEALVIETTRAAYRRIVLQHPDRHDLAWWISERIPRAR